MKTELIYYKQPYLTKLSTTITSINQTPEDKWNIQLGETIFYPEGGGQPGDRGSIEGPKGKANLLNQKIKDDKLIHVCEIDGNLKAGEMVQCKLDWNWRYKFMTIHSAGHLVHDCLMTFTTSLKPIKGGHGSKAFIEYTGEVDPKLKDNLEALVNQKIEEDLPIIAKETQIEELEKTCQFIPLNLPKNKPIRVLQIGNFPPMPDGGVQVKSTKEIGKVRITSLQSGNNLTKVTYQVIQMN